jgi:hypothetical protein
MTKFVCASGPGRRPFGIVRKKRPDGFAFGSREIDCYPVLELLHVREETTRGVARTMDDAFDLQVE